MFIISKIPVLFIYRDLHGEVQVGPGGDSIQRVMLLELHVRDFEINKGTMVSLPGHETFLGKRKAFRVARKFSALQRYTGSSYGMCENTVCCHMEN